MNHRERVMAAIHHKELDRFPVDRGGMWSTGIMVLGCAALKAHLGLTEGISRVHSAEHLADYYGPTAL